jgi:catechol 2,3-dioxygenase-like lactoylglutathione lyase family enzyme
MRRRNDTMMDTATAAATDSDASTHAHVAVESLDHLVLTVRDLEATLAFYVEALGMRMQTFGAGSRVALHFGSQKLNLHVAGAEFMPHARSATPGSADLCFIVATPIEGVVRVLEDRGVEIEQGPVERTGATGQLLSIYVRDPDGNLVELANRLDA